VQAGCRQRRALMQCVSQRRPTSSRSCRCRETATTATTQARITALQRGWVRACDVMRCDVMCLTRRATARARNAAARNRLRRNMRTNLEAINEAAPQPRNAGVFGVWLRICGYVHMWTGLCSFGACAGAADAHARNNRDESSDSDQGDRDDAADGDDNEDEASQGPKKKIGAKKAQSIARKQERKAANEVRSIFWRYCALLTRIEQLLRAQIDDRKKREAERRAIEDEERRLLREREREEDARIKKEAEERKKREEEQYRALKVRPCAMNHEGVSCLVSCTGVICCRRW
jgi:hypothetical protein